MTYYFIKEDPSTAPNQWALFAAVDGKVIDLENETSGNFAAAQAARTAADDAQVTFDAIVAPTPAQIATLQTALDAARAAELITNPIGGGISGPLAPTGAIGARIEFNASGDFIAQIPTPADGGIISTDFADYLPNGADPSQTVKIDFNLDPTAPNPNEPTQFASNFEVTALNQDGLAVGRLTGIDIGTDGLVRATYSNGTSQPLSRIAMVNFANEQGLSQVGNTGWKESIVSGEALAGEAGSGTFGTINSSALEQSNVNLTTELIDLISAQRNFQANSRALEVDNQLNQTILQIR
jgi:flagellar hook protein FlgE